MQGRTGLGKSQPMLLEVMKLPYPGSHVFRHTPASDQAGQHLVQYQDPMEGDTFPGQVEPRPLVSGLGPTTALFTVNPSARSDLTVSSTLSPRCHHVFHHETLLSFLHVPLHHFLRARARGERENVQLVENYNTLSWPTPTPLKDILLFRTLSLPSASVASASPREPICTAL